MRQKKSLLILAQIVSILALPVWIFIAMFAPMLFDGGANPRTWVLFWTCLAMPALIVVFSILMWLGYKLAWRRLQIAAVAFLLFSPLPLIIFSV